MATKKQKHEAALAKRKEFMEKIKAEGLEAQRIDHVIEQQKAIRIREHVEAINARYAEILARAGIRR